MSPSGVPGADPRSSAARWFLSRVRRHWYWVRTQGVGRLVEEDRLNPRDRAEVAFAKWRWRRAHPEVRGGTPVYVVGLQRSGTNMLVRGLERAPEVEVHNENDARAFVRFGLRPDPEIRALVDGSRHPYVLLKPLCDSHRTAQLLDGLGASRPGRAVWVYRDVDDRARSALAKFGDANLVALRAIAAGRRDLWQAGGLSDDTLEAIERLVDDRTSEATAAALLWYARNLLYFDLGLHERDDVTLLSYEAMIAVPERRMRALCAFLGFPYRPELVAHIAARGGGRRPPLAVDAEVRARCDELAARLDRAAEEKTAAFAEG